MIIEWNKIKNEIKLIVSKTLNEGSPSYSESEIDLAINRLLNIIHFKVSVGEYNNMERRLLPALERALITHRQPVDDLVTIATQLESFMKKTCLILGHISSADLVSKSYRFGDLYRFLNLNSAISSKTHHSQNPILNRNHVNSYKGQVEYLFELCYSKIIRNTVHDSSILTPIEFANYTTYLFSTYVYVALVNGIAIDQVVPDFIPSASFDEIDNSVNKNDFLGFSYLTYGRDLADVKVNYINAFLQLMLFNSNSSIDELNSNANANYNLDTTTFLIRTELGKLRAKGEVLLDSTTNKFSLSPSKYNEVKEKIETYRYNLGHLESSIDSILIEYGIQGKSDLVLNILKDFGSVSQVMVSG